MLRKFAYVSEYNIFVESLRTGEITQITQDGGGNIINGTFDWVYEEELGCRDGLDGASGRDQLPTGIPIPRIIGTFLSD